MALVNIFEQILDAFYRGAGFKIDMSLEFLTEVGIIRDNPPVMNLKQGPANSDNNSAVIIKIPIAWVPIYS